MKHHTAKNARLDVNFTGLMQVCYQVASNVLSKLISKSEQAMREHPDIGLITTGQQTCNLRVSGCVCLISRGF